jgi:hypothetical protein
MCADPDRWHSGPHTCRCGNTYRLGDWLQTNSGLALYPIDPRLEEIEIGDIAHSLANLCRFAGHSREFYSVAQHSVLVSYEIAPESALEGLLHDGSEYGFADLPRPIKRHPELQYYRRAEERLQQAIFKKFGCKWPMPEDVKRADNVLLITEQRDLMAPPPMAWKEQKTQPRPEPIVPWDPNTARRKFLERFVELTLGRAEINGRQRLISNMACCNVASAN